MRRARFSAFLRMSATTLVASIALLLAAAAAPAMAAVHTAHGSGLELERGPASVRRGSELRYPLRVDRRDVERTIAAGRPLMLPSTSGAPIVGSDVRLRTRADGLAIVTGTIATTLGPQSFVLTLGDDVAFGHVPQRDGAALRIETRDGRAWLVEGGKAFASQTVDFLRVPPPTAAQRETRRRQDMAKADGPRNVDVLVLYTPTLVDVWGSHAAMQARIAHLEAITNQAYVDSDVDQTITVVGSYLVDYVSVEDNHAALDLITNVGTSPLAQDAHRLRAVHGADLVALLREFDRAHNSTCGVGWLGGFEGQAFDPAWGFSVSADHGFGEDHCGEWTFAHELGHNMGAHHDIETSEGEYGAYPYSRGFRRTLSPDSGFATVMAYTAPPQVRLGQFSNPRLSRCLGQPCGDAVEADNARGLNQSAPSIAAFGTRPTASTPDLRISDVTVVEGNGGQTNARLVLSLSAPAPSTVTINVETVDGTAVMADYISEARVLQIAAGASSVAFDARVRGDTAIERDEYFAVAITEATGARIVDAQGVVTIDNDEAIAEFTLADAEVAEGDTGTAALTFTASLSAPSPQPVRFDIDISEYSIDGAVAPGDYTAQAWDDLTIPAGATSVQFAVTVIGDTLPEADERIRLVASNLRGAEIGRDWARGWIRDDDDTGTIVPPLATRDDRFNVAAKDTAPLHVVRNDAYDATRLAQGSLSVTGVSAGGTATAVFDAAGDPSTWRIDYRAAAGHFGLETVDYRLCEGPAHGRCVDGSVQIDVGILPRDVSTADGNGHIDLAPSSFQPSASTRFVGAYTSTPLVAPTSLQRDHAVDPTPESPWDGTRAGAQVSVHTVPSPPGEARDWKIHVEAVDDEAGIDAPDVYVGIDTDGGQDADVAETRCVAAMDQARNTCVVDVTHPGTGVVRYWVMVHNRAAQTRRTRTDLFDIPLIAGDGTLTITGPGQPRPGGSERMRIAWNDPTLLDDLGGPLHDDVRVGYFGVRVADGGPLYRQALRATRSANTAPSTALRDGTALTLALQPGAAQDRLFFDVPVGASQLTVTTTSARNIDLYLARAASPSSPQIDTAPARSAAGASATTASGNETIILSGSQLSPGRWYVTPVNADATPATLTVTAALAGAATPTRPGSYYDPARSGHGVFLYPAGGQWAGLWYTYFEDGTPTWYYLQGDAPGADGIWTGALFRTMWSGTTQTPVEVGHATVTPTGPDQFVFTWSIDADTGSEPMTGLGRGCPTLGGQPVDASSHWFNPATSGTGHSVQFWEDYEFFAAFVYDAAGVPRFLTAENGAFAGADATMPIEQLAGFCPLCTRTGAPLRQSVGTLRRVLSGGTLQSIGIEATFASPLTGTWSRLEALQPLGGEDTTQGCAP